MPNKRRQDFLIPLLTVLFDATAIEAAFLFSYWLRFYSKLIEIIPVTLGFPPLDAYIEGSFIVIPIWLWIFNNRQMYRPRRTVSFSDEFFIIVRLIIIGMLVVMAVAFFYRTFSYSRIVLGLIGLTAVIFISLERFALLKLERWLYSIGFDLKRVIIVGTSSVTNKVYSSLTANNSLGYEVLGYFSIDGNPVSTMEHIPHLGSISAVSNIIKSKQVDVVLIALNESEYPLLRSLVIDCQGLNVEMMMVPDILELMTSQVRIRHIEGIPFLGIKSPSLSTWNIIIKRAFDITFAAIILILASPLFLLIPILIKLDSKGPIFYIQERVGLDGEIFKVIKFRSMRIDAEALKPVWSQKHDPRATPFGKFLRRFSLDELPQFINVLIGDMSIVGPRPERPYFVDQFKKNIPRYLERHRVKTGMTGWAQVNGLRGGEASISERTKYDIYYVENWSLVFDCKIILKTIHT